MMEVISLGFPACFALMILYCRNNRKPLSDSAIMEIFRYGCWCIYVNIVTMVILCFGIGPREMNVEYLHSFPFAIKYMVCASFFAVIGAYLYTIMKKYISISFKVEEKEQ